MMLHKIIKKLKVLLPRGIKTKIKNITGFGMTSHKVSTFARVKVDPIKVNIAIYTGGGLGDFIVYLALIDQMSKMCDCRISVFTLSYENASKILGCRSNVDIYYPFRPMSKKLFDVYFEIDHYIHVREFATFRLKRKSKKMYGAVQKIILYNKENIPVTDTVNSQRLLLITRAKLLKLNRWTQLSGGGVFDMSSMRSDIPVIEDSSILTDYALDGQPYITIHFGTDPDAGGNRQTKLWPYENFRDFVSLFKLEYPNIKVVQLSANNETEIPGIDTCIRNADLEDVKFVLKYALTHVSSEGGIAHIATQVGIRCAVLFGPTPVHYYGYPTNVNVVSSVCKECMEISFDWVTKCLRGFKQAECMGGISADTALEAAKKIIIEGM